MIENKKVIKSFDALGNRRGPESRPALHREMLSEPYAEQLELSYHLFERIF
jgi:hypothetical protein